MGQEKACSVEGILHGTLTEKACVDHTSNKRVMDPIPLNAVRAAAADITADTAEIAVAAPVADIAGAATDARAALAGAAADTAVTAADVAAAADSAGDLYHRACRVPCHCGLHVSRSAHSGRHFWL